MPENNQDEKMNASGGLLEFDQETLNAVDQNAIEQEQFRDKTANNAHVLYWVVFSIVLLLLLSLFFFAWNIMSLSFSRQAGRVGENFSPEGLIAVFAFLAKLGLVILPIAVVIAGIFIYRAKKRKTVNPQQ